MCVARPPRPQLVREGGVGQGGGAGPATFGPAVTAAARGGGGGAAREGVGLALQPDPDAAL